MSKLILKLNEAGFLTNQDSDLTEVTNTLGKPDYSITDITVMSDEDYYPTIQNILIDLDENHQLNESQEVSKGLSINILSETVNQKTGYSNSLFEFESKEGVITLSLVLSESDKYDNRGVFNVSLYTTKGEKIYESNTSKPKAEIKKILNELSNKYLVSTSLNESVIVNNDDSKSISDKPKLDANEFEDLMTCVRGVLDGTALPDDFDASLTLYVDKVKDRYKVSMKQSKNTQAIITPERNVYLLNLTEITNQDDTKVLANPDKDNAKAPKEIKKIEARPKEIKESEDTVSKLIAKVNNLNGKKLSRGKIKQELSDLVDSNFNWYKCEPDDDYEFSGHFSINDKDYEFCVNFEDGVYAELRNADGEVLNESEEPSFITVPKELRKRINYEDDIVIVYNPKGEVDYKGIEDYNQYRDADWTWNEEHKYYTHVHDGKTYYEVCLDIDGSDDFFEAEESKSFNKARFVFGVNNLADLQDKLTKQLVTKSLYNVINEIKVSDADYEKISSDFTALTNLLDSTETPKDTDTLSVFRITTEAGDRPILLVSTDLKYFGIDYSNLPKETSEDEV